MSEYSKMINSQFDKEILKFKDNPPPACDRKTALKLLCEFERDSIDFSKKFWPSPVEKFLPAVVEGTMFLGEESFDHSEAMKIAMERVKAISYRDVASAFIYGVARGVPAYRTALPAYLHLKNIPEHKDEHLSVSKIYTFCDLCDYHSASSESKMSFMWINASQYQRIYNGGYLGPQAPQDSSFLLREFAKMPKVTVTDEDFRIFVDSLKLAEQLPPDKKIGAYKQLLQKSKALPMKVRELQPYLDILGFLDILHTKEHHGITVKFMRHREMKEADEHKNDYGYPVRLWRAYNGVDWDRVRELFGELFP